jgi:TatD DNase family protein
MENTTIPFINIHTHRLPDNKDIIIFNTFPDKSLPGTLHDNVYFSSGIHPWYMDGWENQFGHLKKLVEDKRLIAIGECGLDKKITTSIKTQEKVFCLQVELSEKAQVPVIIHCVSAFNEIIQIRENVKAKMPWIIHGFNASLEIAKQCIETGMMLSFGSLLFKENTKAAKVMKDIPISVTFLETDESKLTISDIYSRYSTIKGIPMDILKAEIAKNFDHYFKS